MCKEVSVGVDCCGIDGRHEPLFRIVEAMKKNATTPFRRKQRGKSEVNGRFRAQQPDGGLETRCVARNFSHSTTLMSIATRPLIISTLSVRPAQMPSSSVHTPLHTDVQTAAHPAMAGGCCLLMRHVSQTRKEWSHPLNPPHSWNPLSPASASVTGHAWAAARPSELNNTPCSISDARHACTLGNGTSTPLQASD